MYADGAVQRFGDWSYEIRDGRLVNASVPEEWKNIEGWPYDISNYGHVIKLRGRSRQRFIKYQISSTGNSTVRLSNEVNTKRFPVHYLVCVAFNGPPPFEGATVRHDNGDPSDNYFANLTWGTAKEHLAHKKLHGQAPYRREPCAHSSA